ncbi:MAG: two-component system OmpR family sensor kinase [Polyangiales bacterium]|jgi:two-component system OmpR family sensor kinase
MRHGESGARTCSKRPRRGRSLRRILFKWFLLSLMLSSGASALTFSLVSDREWGGPIARGEAFLALQFARVWDDASKREELAQDLESEFAMSVRVMDAEGVMLRAAPSCDEMHSFTIRGFRDGDAQALLGRVELCMNHERPAWWRIALVVGAGLSVVLLLSGVLAHRLSFPLRRVAQAAQRLADGDFEARVGMSGGHDETQLLAQVFNHMAERLGKQIEEQREVLALVSHEVRTPLGHLRLLIEMGREGSDVDWDELALETEELEELMAKLLARSRVDAGHVERSRVDVLELAQRALARQGIDEAKATLDGHARMFTLDPTLVARALSNLVRNAETHGGGLTQIVVHVGDELRIDVKDVGLGLGEEPVSDGLGLGLPLVRAIAAAHDGDLTFVCEVGVHTARLEMPVI